MESVTGVDKNAAVPKFHRKPLTARVRTGAFRRNEEAPAAARKACSLCDVFCKLQ